MFEFFDDIFDMNHDGQLDAWEQGTETAVFFNFLGSLTREGRDVLVQAGLDPAELDAMDEDELRLTLLNAGFDPADFGL